MNRKINLLLQATLLLCFFFLLSCKSPKTSDNGYYFQNFDDLKLWDNSVLVTDLQAHSGKYCAYTDSTHEYSQTFEMPLADAQTKGYNTVQVSAWCIKVSAESKALLKASVESPQKNSADTVAAFATSINTPNMWTKQVVQLKIPDQAPADSKIKVYVWSPNKETSYIDDVEIEFLKQ